MDRERAELTKRQMELHAEEFKPNQSTVVWEDNRQAKEQGQQSSATKVTEAIYDSNRGGDATNFGNPTFEGPVNIKARQNEAGTEPVVIGPEPSTNTAGRTQYINNTGGIAAIYGNATYKKEYSVN